MLTLRQIELVLAQKFSMSDSYSHPQHWNAKIETDKSCLYPYNAKTDIYSYF